MDTVDVATASKSNVVEPTMISLVVSDPEVLIALSEYPEVTARTNFLLTALKVGVLSLKAARGTLDRDTLRQEGDRVMDELSSRLNMWRSVFEERVTGSLKHYFDPQQGTFAERVNRLTKSDGDLATVIRQQVQEAQANLSGVFEQFVGENSQLFRMLDPTGDNQLIATLQQTLDSAVQTQNIAILSQFSLDNKDGALVRFLNELTSKYGDLSEVLSRNMQAVTAEFSLDDENSALSRLVSRVETAQNSLTNELSLDNQESSMCRLQRMLEGHQQTILRQQMELSGRLESAIQSMAARRGEAEKSTRHGGEFENALGEHLRERVRGPGDILEDTGTTTGLKPNCKIGDYVVTIGPDKVATGARIVIEAKENASYDLAKTLAEANEARINRQASVCVFVHSIKTAAPTIPTFQRFGADIVVKWDADDDGLDVWLDAALMVATALSVKAASHNKQDAVSFDKLDQAIARIRKCVEGFEEINTAANTTKVSADRILTRARLIQESLSREVQSIVEEVEKLRDDTAAG
jgi:hypothetical protein